MDIKPPKKRRRIAQNFPARQLKNGLGSSQLAKPYINNVKKTLNKSLNKAAANPSINNVKSSINKTRPRWFKKIENKPRFIAALAFISSIGFLYFFKLLSVPPKSYLDDPSYLGVQSSQTIINNISFGPQKVFDYALYKIGIANVLSLRLASVFISLFVIVLFYLLIKRWMGVKVAWLATILFATSSLLLAAGRSADFINIYFAWVPLVLMLGVLIKNSAASKLIFLFVFLTSLMLYVPGFIYLLLAAVAIYSKYIYQLLASFSIKSKALFFANIILPIMPLIYFLSIEPASIKTWLGIPDSLTFSNVLSNIKAYPNELFLSGIDNLWLWQPGTPVMDGATLVLVLAGSIYLYKNKLHPLRKLTLGLFFLIISLLILVLGNIYLAALLPVLYIVAGYGILYLIKIWVVVFPSNPLARNIGYSLLIMLVGFIAFYHTARYFIVWPRNGAVKEAFDKASSDTINTSGNNNFKIIRGENNE